MYESFHNHELELSFCSNPLKNERLLFLLIFFFGGSIFGCVVAVFLDEPSIEKYVCIGILVFTFFVLGLSLTSFRKTIWVSRGKITTKTQVLGISIHRNFSGVAVFLKENEVSGSKISEAGTNPVYFYDFRVSEDEDCPALSDGDEFFEKSQVFVGNAERIFLKIPKNTILTIAKVFENQEIYAQKKHFRTNSSNGLFNDKFILEP